MGTGLMLRKPGKMLDGINMCGALARLMLMLHVLKKKKQNKAVAVWASSDLSVNLRMFVPIATAHLYCTHYSLGKRMLRIHQMRAPSKTQQNVVLMAAALTWCENIFVGCMVTPTFILVHHFLF